MDSGLRALVWQRAKGRCEYCLFPAAFALLPFQIDHIIAEKHRGPTSEANLALSCERCNSHKGANIAGHLDGQLVRLFDPRRDTWTDHFAWDGPMLTGTSPIGRVTVLVLEINRPGLIAVRRSLMEEGVYPLSPDL